MRVRDHVHLQPVALVGGRSGREVAELLDDCLEGRDPRVGVSNGAERLDGDPVDAAALSQDHLEVRCVGDDRPGARLGDVEDFHLGKHGRRRRRGHRVELGRRKLRHQDVREDRTRIDLQDRTFRVEDSRDGQRMQRRTTELVLDGDESARLLHFEEDHAGIVGQIEPQGTRDRLRREQGSRGPGWSSGPQPEAAIITGSNAATIGCRPVIDRPLGSPWRKRRDPRDGCRSHTRHGRAASSRGPFADPARGR